VTVWTGLRSPASGLPLHHDTPHSLSDGTERWPIVEGIPFLRINRRALADAALAALDAGQEFEAAVVLLADQDDWARTAVPSEDARRSVLRQAGALSFRAAMDILKFGPVGTYFAHRWSDPTFLSGLALAEAHRAPGSVFELACGAGHFLREFGRSHALVAGGDIVFAKLWLARQYVARDAGLICFDAAAPWPFADASFGTVFCHDAFYFLPEKPHVAAEMRRVAAGPVLVGHAHNALVDNLSAGSPLSPAEYAALFGGATVYDDRELTAALVDARAPRAEPASVLGTAPAVSMAVDAGLPRAVVGGVAMPPAGAVLRRNPLYDWDRVRWPSERYEREYAALATYPMEAEGPESAVAGDPAVEHLVRRRILLDLPPAW
jgi:SAM-dependent methyltransferase